MAKVKDKLLKPGTYTGKIVHCALNKQGQLELVYKLDQNKGKVKQIVETDISIPELGHTKYYVANQRLGIYTCIGADNLHHASNKATKLFGPDGWDFLRSYYQVAPSLNGFEAKPYKEFKELIKTVQN